MPSFLSQCLPFCYLCFGFSCITSTTWYSLKARIQDKVGKKKESAAARQQTRTRQGGVLPDAARGKHKAVEERAGHVQTIQEQGENVALIVDFRGCDVLLFADR